MSGRTLKAPPRYGGGASEEEIAEALGEGRKRINPLAKTIAGFQEHATDVDRTLDMDFLDSDDEELFEAGAEGEEVGRRLQCVRPLFCASA